MEKLIKIGEVEVEVIEDISTTDTLNVLLRIGWGAETTSQIDIKPEADLKAGDGVKIIIEKIYEEPEPEPEPVPEATEEAAAGETTEAPKAKTEGAEAEAVKDAPEAEGEEKDTTEKA